MPRSNRKEDAKPPRLHPIANIYALRVLDTVVELARAVAYDFVKRPRHYRDCPDDISEILLGFRSLLGSAPNWPDAPLREAMSHTIVTPLLPALASFQSAALALSERRHGDDEEALRQTLHREVGALQPMLRTFDGQRSSFMDRQIAASFDRSTEVLRSSVVAQAFGLSSAPDDDWPLGGAFSGDAAYLCETIRKTYAPSSPLPQSKFILLQRIAHYGSLSISAILDDSQGPDGDERIDTLAHNGRNWAEALQQLMDRIDIVQAWKEPYYRRSLEIAERDLLPSHPAGEMALIRTSLPLTRRMGPAGGGGSFSTETVGTELCCSTGDLSCGTGPFPSGDTEYCGPTNIGFTCGGCIQVAIARQFEVVETSERIERLEAELHALKFPS